jgi:tetratricopeptide (TPR) repeat protein
MAPNDDKPGPQDPVDAADRAHWTAVEEATELLHEERFREALVELRKVLEADPRNPYAYFYTGVAFFEVGEVEAARDAYEACLKLAPKHLGARVALSHVRRGMGDLRGAIREGMGALSQAPGDGDALYAVGLAHKARGDDLAARRYLEAFLATNPEFEVATEVKGMLAQMPGGTPRGGSRDGEDLD